ncbi:MAG TPA: hypothetical protein VMN79_18230 [Casimicrobiaceae bacterium]|nr:hypothetical protein [Casimicrobiaceae bacterium]
MNPKLRWLAVVAALICLSGCYAYAPYPYAVSPSPQERFDRAWAAASGAMYDQGLTITSTDRGAGMLRGERNGVVITALIQNMPDGSLQTKFNSSNDAADPNLVNRVSEAYVRRVGN